MKTKKNILVTGGAGFIGSHTCKWLAQFGFCPVVYDNLSNGFAHNVKWGPLVIGDICDAQLLKRAFLDFTPSIVIHFAASSYVGESVRDPAKYYKQNASGTLTLLTEMVNADVKNIVFSSTCAVYGIPEKLPISEADKLRPVSPYGASKLMAERMITDFSHAYGIKYAILRYFNACGADLDGDLVEEHDPETHLIPLCLKAIAEKGGIVDIYGKDYLTPDGTCIRDYIHVCDLAKAHVAAANHILASKENVKLNLGTGAGHSILEILSAIHRVTGREVLCRFGSRRPGDPPILFADASTAKRIINFEPTHSDLPTIISTAWKQYARKQA